MSLGQRFHRSPQQLRLLEIVIVNLCIAVPIRLAHAYLITDGHVDFYARFARPGVVIAANDRDPDSFDHAVTQAHLEILKSEADADGNPLEILTLETPSTVRPEFDNPDFAAGYINFYVINSAVLLPEFGDRPRDLAAQDTLRNLFPGRTIIPLNIDAIAAGGGGIHCTTQQEPQL